MAFSLAALANVRPFGRQRSRAWGWQLCSLVGISFLLFAGPLAAKAFEIADSGWEGMSEFYALAQAVLGKAHVEVVSTLDYEHLTRNDGVLVLHPKNDLNYNELSAFLRAGGRLAILDDRGDSTRFLAHFQIHRVEAPSRPAETLRDNPNLAIAVPAVEQVAGQEQNRHPVVAGVDRVVTNHPTALVHPNLTQVLKIPALGEPDATLALTGIIAKSGRLFVMGDPSVLINEMLRYPGNRALAGGLVKYLVENDAGVSRGGKLYVVANEFGQRGHFGGSRGVFGELSNVAEALSGLTRELAKNGLPAWLAIGLSVLASGGVLVWAFSFSARGYRRALPRYAAQPALAGQGGLVGRAAVLAAPSTDPVLLILELHAALNEALCDRLKLARLSSPDRILAELAQTHLLDAERIAQLAGLFREFARAQASLLSRKRLNLSKTHSAQISRKVLEILEEIEQRSAR